MAQNAVPFDDEVLDGAILFLVVALCLIAQFAEAEGTVAGVGLTAARLFSQGTTFTYDDIIFHPGHIDFAANQVSGGPDSQIFL